MSRNPFLDHRTVKIALFGCCLAPSLVANADPSNRSARIDAIAFYEAYLDQVPPEPSRGATVGVTVVGVRFGGPIAQFDPAALRIRLGDAHARFGSMLCLKIISRDGRYFGRSQYDASKETVPIQLVEYKTAYEKVLASYSNHDLAAAAFRSANCSEQNAAEFVVAEITPTSAVESLVVQIRAGEARVRAQLLRDNAQVTEPIFCDPLQDGPAVGFSSECTIKLPRGLKSGRYQINVGETASTGEIKVQTFPVFLWF